MTAFAALLAFTVPITTKSAPPDDAVVRRLVAALNDADPDVRQNLAVALAKIGPATVEPLTEALRDPDANRRAGAAYALGQIGGAAKSALPALLDLLTDPEVNVRRQVSYAISRIVPAGRLPTVTAAGRTEDRR